jgi:hypothetical protein
METPDVGSTLLRARSTQPSGECDAVRVAFRAEHTGAGDAAPVADRPGGLGFLLRAPGLVLLATAFVIEGYRWLGVIHVGTTSVGSLAFGTPGLALVALSAPVAALVLAPGRRASGSMVPDVIILVAVAVTVATGTALVVGGSAWRAVAGTVDLLLAAGALGAVILEERDRRRGAAVRTTTDA